jgi:hypothetical protein
MSRARAGWYHQVNPIHREEMRGHEQSKDFAKPLALSITKIEERYCVPTQYDGDFHRKAHDF